MPGHQAERIAKLLLSDQAVEWVGLGARDSLRLESALCLYGQDLNPTITPPVSNSSREDTLEFYNSYTAR